MKEKKKLLLYYHEDHEEEEEEKETIIYVNRLNNWVIKHETKINNYLKTIFLFKHHLHY